jgi:hypothetical protein
MAFGRTLRFAGVELLLWSGLYAAYLALRGVAIAAPREALANASSLIHVERAAGVFHEIQVQRLFMDLHAEGFVDAYYLLGFGPLTAAVLLFLGLRRPEAYRALRTRLLVALAIASIGYLLLPTAPPRLVPQLGIADTVGLSGHDTGSVGGIPFDPYAAMPSMHVGWSLLVALAVFQATRRRLVRGLFALHPLLMALTVTATGNHYFVDQIAGAAVALAAIALVAAHIRSRIASVLSPAPRPCWHC